MNRLIAPLLVIATLSFALGITLPLIEIERLWLFSEQPSLVEIIAGLWTAGNIALAMLIACFSLVLPALKLLLLHIAAFNDAHTPHRLTRRLHALARWSMLDVVLVAVVIFAAKTSGLATAISKPGLWFFAGSVIATAAASSLVGRLRQED